MYVCLCVHVCVSPMHVHMNKCIHTRTSDSIRRIFFEEESLNLSLKGWIRINQAPNWERYIQVVQEEDSAGRGKKGHTDGLKVEEGTMSQEMLADSKVWKVKKKDSFLEGLEGTS